MCGGMVVDNAPKEEEEEEATGLNPPPKNCLNVYNYVLEYLA